MDIRIQSEQFDPGAELSRFSNGAGDGGAIVTFTGVVRDTPPGLVSLEIEHYPAMTRPAIEGMAQDARARFNLLSVLVIHRYGILTVGEPIMMVATASAHRRDAFNGADFLMDYLKSRAPFWKRETTRRGSQWVEARSADEQDLARWQNTAKSPR